MPLVSIVIPTFNCESYIGEAVDSVLRQDYRSFEIIVVDDGSTDNTRQVLEKYRGKIRYIYQENGGRSAARNRGIKETRGEYIAFLDADDLWENNKLALQMEYFLKHPDVSLVYADALTFRGSEIVAPSMFQDREPFSGDCFLALLRENFIPTQTVIVKKECFKNSGLFDEALEVSEDYDLWLRIAKEYKLSYVPKVLASYRLHEANVSQNVAKMTKAHEGILRKYVVQAGFKPVLAGQILSYFYFKAGYNLFSANKTKESREYFFKSISFWPLQLQPFKYLLLMLLPMPWLDTLRFVRDKRFFLRRGIVGAKIHRDLRILYLTLGPQSGVAEYISKEFAKKNIDFDILNVSGALSYRYRSFRFLSLKPKDLINTFLAMLQFGTEWRRYYKFTTYAFRNMTRYTESYIKEKSQRYDVILQAGAIFAPSFNHLSIPYVLYLDHTHRISQDYATYGYLKPAARVDSYWMNMESNVYKRASLIFTMSQNVRNSLIRDYGIDEAKIVVVGAGPNLEEIPPDFDKNYDNKRILFVGDNFSAKGGDILIKAFRTVRKEIPEANLVIVGCKPYLDEKGVIVKGWLRKSELMSEYRQASLFVLPTLREAFGISFLEAMVYKLPCIGTNIEAIPEIIDEGKTGFLIPENDPKTLAMRIIALLKDENLTRSMGEKGRMKVLEEFTWNRVVNKIYAYLSKLT